MDRTKIIEKVKEAGIVGAGGGGFPTYKKIEARVDTVIANGAECEPVLSTERYLMETHAEEIVRGLRYVKETTGARDLFIGLKEKYGQAIEAFNKVLGSSSDISLRLMDNYYPAGDEFDMVYNITGRIIPEGGLPLDVGCVVINVNTLLNITRAVEMDEKVTTRWVTVAGEVENPYLAEVPNGISAGELVDAARPVIKDYCLLAGGPMMGEIVDSDYPVGKITGGILVLPTDHHLVIKQSMSLGAHRRRGKSTCDQCFDCTIVCPRSLLGHVLEPHKVMRTLFIAPEHACDYTPAFLCSQCGLCNLYACPLDLSPRNLLKEVVDIFRKKGINNPHREKCLTPHPEREFRKVNAARLAIRIGVDKYEQDRYQLKNIRTGRVIISMKPRIGEPAQPVVKKGDKVRKGDIIGEIPRNALGAMVHASIDGVVRRVEKESIEIIREVE